VLVKEEIHESAHLTRVPADKLLKKQDSLYGFKRVQASAILFVGLDCESHP